MPQMFNLQVKRHQVDTEWWNKKSARVTAEVTVPVRDQRLAGTERH